MWVATVAEQKDERRGGGPLFHEDCEGPMRMGTTGSISGSFQRPGRNRSAGRVWARAGRDHRAKERRKSDGRSRRVFRYGPEKFIMSGGESHDY